MDSFSHVNLPLHPLEPWFISFLVPKPNCGLTLPSHTFFTDLSQTFHPITLLASVSSMPQYSPEGTNCQSGRCSDSDPYLYASSHYTKLIGAMLILPSRLSHDLLSVKHTSTYLLVFFKIQFLSSWRYQGSFLQASFSLYSLGALGILLYHTCPVVLHLLHYLDPPLP